MASTPPYQSKLIPYQKEISYMWYKERATLKTIQAFFNTKSVNILLSALSRFIKRRQLRNDPHDVPKTKSKRLLQNNQTKALSELEKLIRQNPSE
jgi:hypothetical protein